MLYATDAGVQVGGFVTDFDTGVEGFMFAFVTARASGHAVPQYRPQLTFHEINRVLLCGKPLAPQLPTDMSTSSGESFYGWNTREGGAFAEYINLAMSSEFAG
mmetsp:Transcript_117224/g.250503  ORF Transcript_117224/g.250503 Transcript_117224/m.250503 type:complete len:103 (+) Transcript_117224:1635-1943(+)